jgi:hypothetical protein
MLRWCQSDTNNVATPRTPNIANPAKPLNIRRASHRRFIGVFITASARQMPQSSRKGNYLYTVKYFLVKGNRRYGRLVRGNWASAM